MFTHCGHIWVRDARPSAQIFVIKGQKGILQTSFIVGQLGKRTFYCVGKRTFLSATKKWRVFRALIRGFSDRYRALLKTFSSILVIGHNWSTRGPKPISFRHCNHRQDGPIFVWTGSSKIMSQRNNSPIINLMCGFAQPYVYHSWQPSINNSACSWRASVH